MKTFQIILIFFAGLSSLAANNAPEAALKCAAVNFTTEEIAAFDGKAYIEKLENITFVNDSDEEMVLETMTLEFMKGGQVIYVASMNGEEIYKAANKSFQYNKSGLYGDLAPCGSVLAFSRTMVAGECLVILEKTYILNDMPETVRIKAKALNGDATMVELSYEVSLSQNFAPIKLPVVAG